MVVRKTVAAMALGASLSALTPVFAQEAQTPAEARPEPGHFTVVGLAPDDLLNLRATASATGMRIGRLPQGVLVKNYGCAEVRKIRWCKIGDLDNPQLQGWAAARYLKAAQGPPEDIGPVGEELAEEEPGQ